jgi:uncharacterized protein (TIGR03435 family)
MFAFWTAVGQTEKPAFEVASIKPTKLDTGDSQIGANANGSMYTARNVAVRRIIMRAYNVADWRISGGPSWLDTDKYDLDAKPEKPTTVEELRLMLQTLLAERFKLALHSETVERPFFALLQDKAVTPLKPHQQKDGDDTNLIIFGGAGYATFVNANMDRLAYFLSIETGRAVVNKTALEGLYDFMLDYAPIRLAADLFGAAPPSNDSSRPEIFAAVKEQLGLKLESQRGPVDTFHIDHLERPTEN